jgi:hypothetical protein
MDTIPLGQRRSLGLDRGTKLPAGSQICTDRAATTSYEMSCSEKLAEPVPQASATAA